MKIRILTRRGTGAARSGESRLARPKRMVGWRVLALAALAALTSIPVTSVSAAPGSAQGATPASVDPALRQLAAAQPDQTLPVLVVRKDAKAGKAAVEAHGGKIRHEAKTFNLLAADLAATQLDALASDPSVVRISYDAPMQATDTSDPLGGSRLQTAFPSTVGAPLQWGAGIRGSGVGVAVLDSGISTYHPDFQGTLISVRSEQSGSAPRVIKSIAISQENQGSPSDDYGHGTWVAGILAGRGWSNLNSRSDNNQYVGIAPDANLINVKVSGRDGQAYTSDVIAGLEWVADNQATYNIKVANLSLVAATAESYTTSYLDAAVEMAWFKGITVVVSAGNSGPNTMLYAPANDPYVIVVGATDDKGSTWTGDDQLASFSGYGTTQDGFAKPDIVAPGRHIVGPLSSTQSPLAQTFPTTVVNPLYIRLSGTSAAAPVVSGAIADVFQKAAALNVNLTPDQVKWLMLKTAAAVPGAGTGAGYPDVTAAVNYLAANPTAIGQANQKLVPNQLLQAAYGASIGLSWNNVSWNNVSWNNVSWNNVSWNNVSWNNVSWNNVSWNNVSWNNVAGE